MVIVSFNSLVESSKGLIKSLALNGNSSGFRTSNLPTINCVCLSLGFSSLGNGLFLSSRFKSAFLFLSVKNFASSSTLEPMISTIEFYNACHDLLGLKKG
jgi:hypothetical protein